ncbi:MAG: hypothetical protein AAFO29_26985 [Actinomycetota bacterium]
MTFQLCNQSPQPRSTPMTPDMDHQTHPAAASERGAVGTEMAIVVAIVVAIAVALGVVMTTSADNHQECIPENPGDAVDCDFGG